MVQLSCPNLIPILFFLFAQHMLSTYHTRRMTHVSVYLKAELHSLKTRSSTVIAISCTRTCQMSISVVRITHQFSRSVSARVFTSNVFPLSGIIGCKPTGSHNGESLCPLLFLMRFMRVRAKRLSKMKRKAIWTHDERNYILNFSELVFSQS